MVVVKSLEEYRKLQQKRIAKIKKLKRRGPIVAAKFMVAQLRSMAPRKTGNMISTITRRKGEVSLGGSDRVTGWPYVHWINKTPGMSNVHTNHGKTYAQIKSPPRTGVPGFFWIAQTRARAFNTKSMVRATRAALKSGF